MDFVISWHIDLFLQERSPILTLQHLSFSDNHFHALLQQEIKLFPMNEETWTDCLCFYFSYWKE